MAASGGPPPSHFPLLKHYKFDDFLGEGGQGQVLKYKLEDPSEASDSLPLEVAVKGFKTNSSQKAQQREMTTK